MRSKKYFWLVTLVMISLVGYGVFRHIVNNAQVVEVMEISSSEPEASIYLAFDWDVMTVEPGGVGYSTIVIASENLNDRVSAIAGELTYDPTKIEITNVERGVFFENVLSEPVYTNGVLRFTFATPPDSGGKSVHESGEEIATIHFRSKANGRNKIVFTSNTQVAVVGKNINVLKSATDFELTSTLPTDLNGDLSVDIFDYNMFLPQYGKTNVSDLITSDINKDGKVDIFDYNLFVADYGKSF